LDSEIWIWILRFGFGDLDLDSEIWIWILRFDFFRSKILPLIRDR